MSYREPQTPGLGGMEELTAAEELFVMGLAALAYQQGDILYHNGSVLTRLPAGSAGKVLTTNGTGANPSWETIVTGASWGSITGTLSSQTDLVTALDAKVDVAGDTMTGTLTVGNTGYTRINVGASPQIDLFGQTGTGYYPAVNFYMAGAYSGSIYGYGGILIAPAAGYTAGVWTYYQGTTGWYTKTGYAGTHTVPVAKQQTYQGASSIEFWQGGEINQYGSLTSGVYPLARRTGLTATPSATAGTLPAGTYYYKVSACNFTGETIGSVEASATITAGQSVQLAWTYANMDGVDHYHVYRSTTSGSYPASSRIETTTYPTTGVPYYNTTFLDTGFTATAGSPKSSLTHTTKVYRRWEGQTGALVDFQSEAGVTLAQVKSDGNIEVPTEAFSGAWDANPEVPTKADVYLRDLEKQDRLGGAVMSTAVNAADPLNRIIIQDPNASGELATITLQEIADFAGGGGGGITREVNVVSTNTAAGDVASTDYVYLVSSTTTITLPTAVGNTNRYTIANEGTDTVTIDTTGGETINGELTATLDPEVSLELISNGTNWRII